MTGVRSHTPQLALHRRGHVQELQDGPGCVQAQRAAQLVEHALHSRQFPAQLLVDLGSPGEHRPPR